MAALKALATRAMADGDSDGAVVYARRALTRGDTENFGYWINQAIQYQQDHPGMPGPLEGFSGYMNQHYSRAAMAGAMGLPVGLSPKNIVGRGMLDY